MGSPEFAVPCLRALAGAYPVVGVVTQPDAPAGRGRELRPPAVKQLALELGLALIQPARLRAPEAMAQLQDWSPELIVVTAFGQILRPAVLDLPRYGCINVHASLLPRWRGAAPINAAIFHGDTLSGVTVMRMDPGVDTGPVIAQRAAAILPDEDALQLGDRLAALGANLLLHTLPAYLGGLLTPQAQDERGATYAAMLTKDDGRLDFNRPAEALARQVRAYQPWPGAAFDWNGASLKVLRAHAAPHPDQPEQPGQRLVQGGLPAVVCGSGLLVLDELQPAGKKAMSGAAFVQGARQWTI
ncbi:MAG: methionyl-tRNA formyltransferase [Chloroflexota bacterium]